MGPTQIVPFVIDLHVLAALAGAAVTNTMVKDATRHRGEHAGTAQPGPYGVEGTGDLAHHVCRLFG